MIGSSHLRRGSTARARVGPRRVFVDTGAWFAVQVTDDEWHGDAVRTLREEMLHERTLRTGVLREGDAARRGCCARGGCGRVSGR